MKLFTSTRPIDTANDAPLFVASSKSVRNYLVFFHLTPSGNAGQNQFADSILSETMTTQTFFPCLVFLPIYDMGDPHVCLCACFLILQSG